MQAVDTDKGQTKAGPSRRENKINCGVSGCVSFSPEPGLLDHWEIVVAFPHVTSKLKYIVGRRNPAHVTVAAKKEPVHGTQPPR